MVETQDSALALRYRIVEADKQQSPIEFLRSPGEGIVVGNIASGNFLGLDIFESDEVGVNASLIEFKRREMVSFQEIFLLKDKVYEFDLWEMRVSICDPRIERAEVLLVNVSATSGASVLRSELMKKVKYDGINEHVSRKRWKVEPFS